MGRSPLFPQLVKPARHRSTGDLVLSEGTKRNTLNSSGQRVADARREQQAGRPADEKASRLRVAVHDTLEREHELWDALKLIDEGSFAERSGEARGIVDRATPNVGVVECDDLHPSL